MSKDCLDYNPIQNTSGKIKIPSNVGQDKKTLISPFAQFSSASAKKSLFEARLGTRS